MSTDAFQPNVFQSVIGNGTAFQVFDSFTPVLTQAPFYVPRLAEPQIWLGKPLAQPLVLLSPGPVYTGTISGNSTGNNGYSFRSVITPQLASSGQVRVTFTANSANTISCGHCSIGVLTGTMGSSLNTTATPVELTFSGSSGFSTSTSVVSDWVSLNWAITDHLVVIVDDTSSADSYVSGQGSNYYVGYLASATSYNQATVTGYTISSGYTAFASRIDTEGSSLVALLASAFGFLTGRSSASGKVPILTISRSTGQAKSSILSGYLTLSAHGSGLARGSAAPSIALALAARLYESARGFASAVGKLPMFASGKSVVDGRSTPSGTLPLSAHASGLARGNAAPSFALALAAQLYESARGFASAIGKLPLLARGQSIAESKSSGPSGKLPLSASAFSLVRGLSLPSGKAALNALSSIISSASGALGAAVYTILRARLFVARPGDVGLWQGRPQGQPLTLLAVGAVSLAALATAISRGFASATGKLPLLATGHSSSVLRVTPSGSVKISAASKNIGTAASSLAGKLPLAAHTSTQAVALGAVKVLLSLAAAGRVLSTARTVTVLQAALAATMETALRGRTAFIGSVKLLGTAAAKIMQRGTMSATAEVVALLGTGISQVKAIPNLAVVSNLVALLSHGVTQLKGRAQSSGSLPLAAKTSLASHGSGNIIGAAILAGHSVLKTIALVAIKGTVPLFAHSTSQLKAPVQTAYRLALAAKTSVVSYGRSAAAYALGLVARVAIISAARGRIIFAGSLIPLFGRATIIACATLGTKIFEAILGRPVSGSGGADQVSSTGPGKTNT